MPSNICTDCMDQVNRAVDFRTECERSDAILRQWLTLNSDHLDKDDHLENACGIVENTDESVILDVGNDKDEASFELINILVEYPTDGMIFV